MRAWIFLLVACAPVVDGPVERQRAVDLDDGARLAAQLVALPGTVTAHATIHRPVADPLGTARPDPAAGAILIVVDDRADRAAIARDAKTLAHAVAPEVVPEIVVEVGAKRAELASVGPFTVEAGSRGPLKAALAAILALVAALAGYVAWRERATSASRERDERRP